MIFYWSQWTTSIIVTIIMTIITIFVRNLKNLKLLELLKYIIYIIIVLFGRWDKFAFVVIQVQIMVGDFNAKSPCGTAECRTHEVIESCMWRAEYSVGRGDDEHEHTPMRIRQPTKLARRLSRGTELARVDVLPICEQAKFWSSQRSAWNSETRLNKLKVWTRCVPVKASKAVWWCMDTGVSGGSTIGTSLKTRRPHDRMDFWWKHR